ncbi:LysR family transcriptional regulator [Dendronalium sp. ChiSLP03b]|uniref:LysR family transcriptional regulator n=1 Tax=Dendronalium sp. ChiSLP03b TaxID=3075381 RepID=UPI002AD35520|nr:LysR family transcriptional regulator [Dendronalium sp. ChiSLP03b]MDZ8205507.1 LysR family transcriptional regulator [Dendronalium sp. ChiSLP03b]
MLDRFEDIRTFVAVVQANSFVIAANRLGLAKSAVSRRLRELENRLGTQLLNRTTRQLSLTDTGAEFYARCIRLLSDLQEAEDIASQGSATPVGTLRVSGPMSFGIHCLTPMLNEFLADYRRVTVDLNLNDRRVDIINDGFDLAVRISRLKDSSLLAHYIAPIRHAICASPIYLQKNGIPKTLEDLIEHQGLAYSNVDDRLYWQFHDPSNGELQSVDVPCALRLNNGDALREAAIAGCGIAVLPTFIIHKAVMSGQLRVILSQYTRSPFGLYAVYPSGRNLPAKVRVFIDFLLSRFGPEPYWDRDIRDNVR